MFILYTHKDLLCHFKHLNDACEEHGANATLNCKSFYVKLNIDNATYTLYPQFLAIINNLPKSVDVFYTSELINYAKSFVGWRPYETKASATFMDKRSTKAKLQEQGFLVPASYIHFQDIDCDYIVKKSDASFGQSITGPFKLGTEHPIDIAANEFYEQFIHGDVIKILFWNEKPVYMEQHAMPELIGNGKNTILELAQKRARKLLRGADPDILKHICAYQDKTLDTVLAKGEKMLIDFRYESSFLKQYAIMEVPLPNYTTQHYDETLTRLGEFVHKVMKNEGLGDIFYTVDAILDKDQQLWLLEVNSNPTINPCGYRHMIATLKQNVGRKNPAVAKYSYLARA